MRGRAPICLLTALLLFQGGSEPERVEEVSPPLTTSLVMPGSGECIADPETLQLKAGDAVFCGALEAGAAEKIVADFLQSEAQRLYFSSPGGFSEEAIRLASDLDDAGIALHLFGECLSACAHFLLSGVDDITVETETLIGFHHTAAAQLELLTQTGLSVSDEAAKIVHEQAGMQYAFYQAEGINPLLLTKPFRELGPECIDNVSTARIDVRARWVMWTPSRDFLDAMRPAPVKGWWPKDRYEHLRTVALRYPSLDMPQSFRFQNETEFGEGPGITEVDWCEG
jgi:hypothetical protein